MRAPSGGSIEQVRATTLFQAIGDCSGLTAAVYASVEPEARLLIALDERIDDLIVSSIFGEAIAADAAANPGTEAGKPRTAIEAALLEAFARALGTALQAGFAPFAPIVLNFERFATLTDSFVLEKRDNEAAAARFSLQMNGGACECLVLLPQTLLLPFRKELEHDPEADTPAADRRWSRLMEAGVQQARLPVTAILEDVPIESRRHRQSSGRQGVTSAMNDFSGHSPRMFRPPNVHVQTRPRGRSLPSRNREPDRHMDRTLPSGRIRLSHNL